MELVSLLVVVPAVGLVFIFLVIPWCIRARNQESEWRLTPSVWSTARNYSYLLLRVCWSFCDGSAPVGAAAGVLAAV